MQSTESTTKLTENLAAQIEKYGYNRDFELTQLELAIKLKENIQKTMLDFGSFLEEKTLKKIVKEIVQEADWAYYNDEGNQWIAHLEGKVYHMVKIGEKIQITENATPNEVLFLSPNEINHPYLSRNE